MAKSEEDPIVEEEKSEEEQEEELDDIEMEEQEEADEEENQIQQPKNLQIHAVDDSASNATFTFYKEDHTLGNLLRNTLVKNKEVEFCAYSVPHPSEPYMNVRIQSVKDNVEAKTLLRHSLKRIAKTCDVMTEKFESAFDEFEGMQD